MCATAAGGVVHAAASRGVTVSIRSATFRGVRYRVDVDSELHGFALNQDVPLEKEICVSSHLSPRAYLDCLLHEALHACFVNSPEQEIDRAATDLARFLWRLGYRKVT